MQIENSVWAWGLRLSKYIKEAVCKCKKYVEENLLKFYKLMFLAPNPFPTDYQPELDALPELPLEHASYYQSLMGMRRWMIKLGRVDISIEVSMLLLHVALSCQGNLEAALHIMLYLSLHHNSCLCMDPTYPVIDSMQFLMCDLSEFYGEVEEPISHDAPEAIGKVVDFCMFVNSDNAGDQCTYRSHSGFLIYLCSAHKKTFYEFPSLCSWESQHSVLPQMFTVCFPCVGCLADS